jgi:hypothetical protein
MLIIGLAPSVFAQEPEIYENTNQNSELFSILSHDNEVYDNGPPNAGGVEVESFVIADDFVLNARTIITDLHFQTFEFAGPVWDETIEYFIYDDAGGEPGNLLTNGNGQNLVKNNLGGTAYEYSIDLDTDIELDGGVTYWLAIHLAANYDDQLPDPDVFIAMTNQIDGNTIQAAVGDFVWFPSANNDMVFILTGHPPDTVVGGTLLDIDTTVLLLAGAQSFSWMIPVVLSGIGIGLFLFRKSKNS